MVQIKYVVDTWAWIEYLISGSAGDKVKEIVENEDNEIYINSIILAEVISKSSMEKMDAKTAFDALTTLAAIADINKPDLSREAGLIHAEMRKQMKDFGLSDAFVMATARKLNARVLTGNPHFKGLKEAVMI